MEINSHSLKSGRKKGGNKYSTIEFLFTQIIILFAVGLLYNTFGRSTKIMSNYILLKFQDAAGLDNPDSLLDWASKIRLITVVAELLPCYILIVHHIRTDKLNSFWAHLTVAFVNLTIVAGQGSLHGSSPWMEFENIRTAVCDCSFVIPNKIAMFISAGCALLSID
jgi:hypothetical protein